MITSRAYTPGPGALAALRVQAGQPAWAWCSWSKNVEIRTPELSQLEIGRWVHIPATKNTIRAHGARCWATGDRFGQDNVINCYIDIEFGESALMADWCYVCDFDHKMDSIELPIKDQGIVKTPVRIGEPGSPPR